VGLHHITWRGAASALDDVDAVADSFAWLIGDEQWVDVERTQSHHGSEMFLISAHCKKKSAALESFAKLGADNLQHLSTEYEKRMDEHNTFHFRLDLNSLIGGKLILSDASKPNTVKGQIKIEVYPGQTIENEFMSLINDAKNRSTSLSDSLEHS
tara:strand:+ start:968 stop:1432 length:465 start_codon:yes stop_codon:yes gene_type:complete